MIIRIPTTFSTYKKQSKLGLGIRLWIEHNPHYPNCIDGNNTGLDHLCYCGRWESEENRSKNTKIENLIAKWRNYPFSHVTEHSEKTENIREVFIIISSSFSKYKRVSFLRLRSVRSIETVLGSLVSHLGCLSHYHRPMVIIVYMRLGTSLHKTLPRTRQNAHQMQ